MDYYRICPDCGASLDPGEVCDCQRSNDELAEYLKEGDGRQAVGSPDQQGT